MSYRYMRTIVFFDLPTITSKHKQAYRAFRKYLLKNGFMQLQYSVYSRFSLNQNQCQSVENLVKKAVPKEGLVQILSITEKQYSKMQYLIGEEKTQMINDDRRLIIL